MTLRLQKKVGVLTKDTSSGPFVDEWRKVYEGVSGDLEQVDIASALSGAALAVKDENELVGLYSRYTGGLLIPSSEQ
jgi:nucleosome binding factor SPN SPT16 subunit